MKCFELRKCTPEEQKACFVFKSYPNQNDLDGVKCWIMNGAFQRGNKAQLEKCLACPYYKELNKESGITQADRTNATVVAVVGAINNDRAKALEDVLGTLLEKKRFDVVLNLRDVNNIYSCGLGIIIRMHKELTAKGGTLVVANTQPYVMNLFESTKLNRFLNIADSEADAFKFLDEKRTREQEKEKKIELSREEAKALERKKLLKCWEFWNGHNPKNANTCDECYRKNTESKEACWIVEGSVEGVSFQYVNEDCEDCEYYLLHQKKP